MQSRISQFKRLQAHRWLLPGITVAIALIAAGSIFSFRARANRFTQVMIQVSSLKQIMAQLDGVEEHAIRNQVLSYDTEKIDDLNQEAQKILVALQ